MAKRLTTSRILINFLKDRLPADAFKAYFEGDPIIPPWEMMPCIIVSETATDYDLGPTGADNIRHTFLIQVVFDKRDDVGNPDLETTTEAKIDDIVHARDEDTGEILSSTIMGVLRGGYTINNLFVQSVSGLRKGVIPRSEELLTIEGHIDLTLEEIQNVSNRSWRAKIITLQSNHE